MALPWLLIRIGDGAAPEPAETFGPLARVRLVTSGAGLVRLPSDGRSTVRIAE